MHIYIYGCIRKPPPLLVEFARTRAEPVLRTRTRATGLDLRRLDEDNVQTGHEPVPRPSQSSFTSWHKVVLGMQGKPNPCPSLPEPVPAHIPRRHPVFEKGGLLPGVLPCTLPEYSQSVRTTSSKSCNQTYKGDGQRMSIKLWQLLAVSELCPCEPVPSLEKHSKMKVADQK